MKEYNADFIGILIAIAFVLLATVESGPVHSVPFDAKVRFLGFVFRGDFTLKLDM